MNATDSGWVLGISQDPRDGGNGKRWTWSILAVIAISLVVCVAIRLAQMNEKLDELKTQLTEKTK